MEMPIVNIPVIATVQHFHTKGKRTAMLIAVDEDDVGWRTCDDDSELSYDWDVIAWEYAPPPEEE